MKAFACFYVLAFVFLQIESLAAVLSHLEQQCVDELHLNQSVIEKWNLQPIIPEDNTELNQFMGCYWKKRGYQDENGEINYTNLQKLFQRLLTLKYNSESRAEEVTRNILKNCRNTSKGKSDGETAARVSNCVIRNIPGQ